MSGGFNNPLVGGGGSLVYPSIHSPDFVAGVAGWSINKDGSAELDNVTIRGILEAIVGGSLVFQTDQFGDFIWFNSHGAQAIAIVPAKQAMFVYADTGSAVQGALILSIAPVAGTDAFGNAYQSGFVSYNTATGSFTRIHGGGGIDFDDPTNAAFLPGRTGLASVGSPSDSTQITSPMAASTDVQGIIAVQRGPAGGLGIAHFLNTAIQATAGTAANPTLITTDVWNALGSLGATGWTFNHARYRMSPLGGVEFDFSATSTANPAPAVTPTAFPNTLPAAYRPAFGRAYPLGYASSISSGTNWPRVLVGTGGTVTVALPGGGGIGTAAAGQFIMPLD